MGIEDYHWQKLKREPEHFQKIRCTNMAKDPEIFLNVKGRKETVFTERSGKLESVAYNLDIRPELVFKNCLPVNIFYSVDDNWDQMLTLEPGKSALLQGLEVGKTPLCLKIFEFRRADWRSRQVIEKGMPELCVWPFEPVNPEEAPGARFDLGINSVISRGTQVLSIYSPFWMINKTGKFISYRGGLDYSNVVDHPVELRDAPMMFSYTGKSVLGKRKTSLRIEESAWSDPFTLDTIEDADKVTCKRKGRDNSDKQVYHVGVKIQMSKSSLTKIITFTPYYLVLNTADFSISIREADSSAALEVPPGACVPFWPVTSASTQSSPFWMVLAFATGNGDHTTPPFSLREPLSTLLSLGNKFGAVHVDCRISGSDKIDSLHQTFSRIINMYGFFSRVRLFQYDSD